MRKHYDSGSRCNIVTLQSCYTFATAGAEKSAKSLVCQKSMTKSVPL